MKTDPNKACSVPREKVLWALVHDLIAHPLMALCAYSKFGRLLHDFTSGKAWPDTPRAVRLHKPRVYHQTCEFGRLRAVEVKPYYPDSEVGFYEVRHPRTGHSVVSYGTAPVVMSRAINEFREWWNLFGGVFEPWPNDSQMYARLRAMDSQWDNLFR